jgi:HEAT repeat protein
MLLSLCTVVLVAGCGGQKSTSDWIDQLQAQEAAARLHAVKALSEDRDQAPTIVAALTATLKDSDAFVRRDAAQALGRFGFEAKSAIPALRAATKDRTPAVRKAAEAALRKVNLPPERASRPS